jgi:hypothetical protein
LEREVIKTFLAGIADKLGLGDALWQIAASDTVIFALAALVFVCVVIAYFPVVSKLPAVAPYAATAAVLVYVFLAAQAFLVGYRFADSRAEAKSLRVDVAIRDDLIKRQRAGLDLALEVAETASNQRDEAAQRAKTAQDELDEYAKRLPASPNDDCRITPDDLAFGVRKDR